ncbi:hypothetical protein [Amycolatopsis sp. EV170708-02-1]|uniref:hypothetical protein n=1 Tax=Amycolatopsis sp. EV170708-02-1 TaxID=2919322 RepID=UPI001F0C69AC|nr:hypothetical protein [Amycolatopsis sp. EV170708-02-1]UMP04215.1 hypothetical protein MJQ72_04985 [Amycolatopsis sp. EV170708-02-1]
MFKTVQQWDAFALADPCTGSPLARLVCDPSAEFNAFMAWLSYTLWAWITVWWPLLVMVAVLALVAGAVLAQVVRLRRKREMEGARFFEITPPHRLPADGAVPLWRLLASTLAGVSARTRVAMVLWADDPDGRIRAGLWVPGGGPARSVARAVEHAWPGCGLTPTEPPRPPAGAVGATELVPSEGPWAPLVDHLHRPERGVVAVEDEPLRAVLEGISDHAVAGRFASVQVVISPSRGGRRRGRGTGRRRGLTSLIGAALLAVMRGVVGAVELMLSSSSSHDSRRDTRSSTRREDDPVTVARRRAREAKQKAGPHLRATVRLVVAGTVTPRTARRSSGELAAVLAALATDEHDTARLRVWRPAGKVARYAHGHGFVASVRELASVWHLPHQPGSHGLPHPEAPLRKADRALPRLDGDRYRRRPGRRGFDGFGGDRNAA